MKRGEILRVIGGSGIYDIEGLDGAEWITVTGPWGAPSDQILTGSLGGVRMAFLPRHGRGHVHSPTTVPYRANIDALKRLGVTDVISVSATGSFREEMAPGDFVIVDQFIDRTFAREKSFFGTGCVAHVSVAHPTCPRLGDACFTAAQDAGITVHKGGTYLAMEGPQFSSLAESKMYRESWGCDVIGMTNLPEARLAREAEEAQREAERNAAEARRAAAEAEAARKAGARRAEVLAFNSGGSGARPALDGMSATAFPSGVMTMPVEATEHTGPVIIWRKELRPDSGGACRRDRSGAGACRCPGVDRVAGRSTSR